MKNTLKTLEDYLKLEAVEPVHRLPYGNHAEQFGDLYLPKTSPPHPVIVLIHGGCWRSQHGLSQLGKLATSLTGLGFAVWNIEFRRLGNGGGWPVTFVDIALAADYLTSIADTYSLDLSRVTAMGHSAGGHLALWLAGRKNLSSDSLLYKANPLTLQRVVSLAGIPDLELGVKLNICRGACQELIGGLPAEVPERYQQGSPHHLLPLTIPQWHLLGELDSIVPVEYLQQCFDKAGPHSEFHFEVIPGIGHFEMVMPDTIAWDFIKKSLL